MTQNTLSRLAARLTAPFLSRRQSHPPAEKKSTHLGPLVALHALSGAGWSAASFAPLAREGFMRNAVVHRCVRLISQSAASVPWLVYKDRAELEDSAAAGLVNRPNALQTRMQFFEHLFGHLLLAGNAYSEIIEGADGAFRLFLLRPDQIEIKCGDGGWPETFVHRAGSNTRVIPAGEGDPVRRVLHVGLFNPLDDVTGFAPMQAAANALDIHNAASEWNKALLDNAARPSGALVYAPGDNSTLTPEQFEQLKAQLEEGYSGASNAGKPLLLEGGLDWKSMGLSPREMDFMEARNGAARDIALAFGVPPMLLGIPGDNTYSNYQEANRAFFRLTVLPLTQTVADAFSAWLEPLNGRGVHYQPDLDRIESLSVERDALWSRLENASFLTKAEKREAVGYTPGIENGEGDDE